jgi:hypothetical protein
VHRYLEICLITGCVEGYKNDIGKPSLISGLRLSRRMAAKYLGVGRSLVEHVAILPREIVAGSERRHTSTTTYRQPTKRQRQAKYTCVRCLTYDLFSFLESKGLTELGTYRVQAQGTFNERATVRLVS